MIDYNIYDDISQRTNGDVYIGVVGPVRTGKSTFIKKFMDLLVIPNIADENAKTRAIDELPQSASGKTIMTTEPKFVPNEAVTISMEDNTSFNVRMIDCVGYIVDSALGHIENDSPRMVSTPWSDAPVSFNEAAECGTKKVICDHSTIGLVVTCDGSFTDIDRKDYVKAEERVIKELQDINKPFIILLNSSNPYTQSVLELKSEMEKKYATPVLPVNCQELDAGDIYEIIERLLFEFPVKTIEFTLPDWIDALDFEHWLKKDVFNTLTTSVSSISRIRHVRDNIKQLSENEHILSSGVESIDLGSGRVCVNVGIGDDLFYRVLSENSGFEVKGRDTLITLLNDLAVMKRHYDKIACALNEVNSTGYGIVSPTIDELTLEEPEMVRQGTRYGVKLKASAPSIHMIRADIETEVSPIVGSEKQSEELVRYLLEEFENDPKEIWKSNIFGKSLHELINEGLNNKLSRMPDDARFKLQETLQKIINEGSGGLICILL